MRIVEDLDSRSKSVVTTPTLFAKSSLLYVQYIGHYYTNSGYSIEREKLESCLFIYTLRGKGYLKYQGALHELSRGKVCLIDCREYHMYQTDPDDLWEFLYVHFEGKTSQDYVEHFMKQGGPVVTVDDGFQIADTIHKIQELQQNMDERSDLLSSRYIVDLLTTVLLSVMQGGGQEEHVPGYITQVKQRLADCLNSSISLDDLTREFAVSKYHLSREFKKFTGYSPYEYLVNLRIKAAKELLKTSHWSIEEITYKVGFTNTTHFIHMFRNRENTTPLQFRKVWQGRQQRTNHFD